MARQLTLALLQHACPLDAAQDQHLATCERLIRQAASQGAQLIVTQELFASPYFPQVEDDTRFNLAEPIPGPTSTRLAALAKELGVSISGSLFERRAPGLYHNTTVSFDPTGKRIGTYRKMHIPDDPRFYEKYYFTPGDLGWQTFRMASSGDHQSDAAVGTLVCWDQWFPEAARLTTLRGAELLLYPTAIGYDNHPTQGEPQATRDQQREAWITIMQSHAITNGVFVAAANRIGTEDRLTFWGSSFVCGPDGKIIAQAPADEEAVLLATIDLDRIEAQRRGWPILRDRRIDAYDGLLDRLSDAPHAADA